MPALRVAYVAVRLKIGTPERPGPQLQRGLDQLDPKEDAPGRDMGRFDHLMLVVPEPEIGADHPAAGGLAVEGCPAIGRGVDRHGLIGIIGQKLPEQAPVAAVRLLIKPHGEGGKADHAMVAQEADRLTILRAGAALLDGGQRRLIRSLDPEKEAQTAGLLVKRQEVGIADDVIGAGGADDGHLDLFGDQRLKKRLPGAPGGGGVSIGEVDEFDALLAHQPGDFARQPDRIAVAPAGPESALPAIGAKMRATARELHDHGAFAAPVAVSGKVDQLPPDPVGVEVADHRRGRGGMGLAVLAKGEAGNGGKVDPGLKCAHQRGHGFLPLAAQDHVDVGGAGQDLVPVTSRVDAAMDDGQVRVPGLQRGGHLPDGRMGGG